MNSRVVIVGCGIFGITAALELRRRGHDVEVIEASVAPSPLAASTDISRIVRLAYGQAETYTALAEEAFDLWLEWNDRWAHRGLPRLFHDNGVLVLSREEMAAGGLEYDSFQTLLQRGHHPERLRGSDLAERFPAWGERFDDSFFHRKGGYIESAGVVWALVEEAREQGVLIEQLTPMRRLALAGDRLIGVEDRAGTVHEADQVLICIGSWTGILMPHLASCLRRSYQPVWHLRPRRPELFRDEIFPVFTADISRTGYYGFPLHPIHAVVKMGHHGDAVESAPGADLVPPDEETDKLREFLTLALPDLANAEIVHSTLCPYCDTADEHFWIARDPELDRVTVAAGGSGHAFKFAPLLGGIIADAVEERAHPLHELFAWRPDLRVAQGFDPMRKRTPVEHR